MAHRIALSTLKNLFPSSPGRRPPIRTRKGHTRKHFLELLEDRCLLSSYTVSNDNYSGSGSLGLAISTAVAANDHAAVISFSSSLAGSTIQLNSNDVNPGAAEFGPTAFYIDGGSGTNITIDGSGAPGLTIDGGNAVRPFVVAGGDALTLDDLTLKDGSATGGAGGDSQSGGAGGGAAGSGGAVLVDGSSFTANGCTFVNNRAAGGAGATPSGGNSVYGGGGGGLGGPGGNASSGAAGNGGGVNGGTHSGRSAGLGGGGAGVGNGGPVGSGYGGGFGGGGGGGGIGFNGGNGGFGGGGGGGGRGSASEELGFNQSGMLTRAGHGTRFQNGGGGGGGFGGGAGGHGTFSHLTGGPIKTTFGNIIFNHTGMDLGGGGGGGGALGGALFSTGGTLTLNNDAFTNNSAEGGAGGGGVMAARGNTAGSAGQGIGGAVFVLGGSLTATSDTYTNNTATNGDGTNGPTGTNNLYDLSFTVTPSTARLPVNAPTIMITGSGFSPTAALDSVLFNDGAAGTVTTASASSLTIEFTTQPTLAGSLTAVVFTNGGPMNTPVQVATVTPVVTPNTATLAPKSTLITIDGLGFDPQPGNNTVTFNDGAVGSVIAASSTSLTVQFSTQPTASGSLTAIVTTDGVSSGAAVQVANVPADVDYLVNVPGDNGTTAAGVASSDGNPLHGDLRYVLNQAIANEQNDSATITFDPAVFTSAALDTVTLNPSLTTAPAGLANPYGLTAFILEPSPDIITIDGSLGVNTPGITIDGQEGTRLFVVAGGGTLQLQNLTLSGGSATGGAGGASATGDGGGGAAGLGGAVLVDGSSFTANGCTFVNDQATGGAGGDSTGTGLVEQSGGGGGGLGGTGLSPGARLGGNGGGVNGGNPDHDGGFGGGGGGGGGIPGLDFRSGGDGGFGGGGGGLRGGGGFGGGGGGGGGGGFGGGGGGGGSGNGGGGGAGLGGAVFSNGGTLTLTNDTFNQNTATGGGGGSGANNGSAGQGYGGAVFVRNGTLTATFDTFSGNTVANGNNNLKELPPNSGGNGSDLYVLSDGNSGSGYSGGTATAAVVDSILGQNGTTTVSDFYANSINGAAAPSLTGSSNNLVSDNPASPNGLPGAVAATNPGLDPAGLASNGGPTQTIALASGSPATAAGIAVNGITTDQRGPGYARIVDGTVDIGAFEVQSVTISTTTAVMTSGTPSTYGDSVTFTATVTSTSTPTGSVDFVIDGGTPVAGIAGSTTGTTATWTYTTSTLGAGGHTVEADYVGTGSFTDSDGTLSGGQTVNPLAVNLTGSRTYDGTTTADFSILTVSNAIAGDTVDVASGSGTLASKDVGSPAITSFGTLALGNNAAGDYTLTDATGTVTITPEAITVTAQANSKTYDGTTSAAATPLVTTGTLYDPATLSETYDTKNVGTGKTLTPLAVINDGVGGADYKVTYVDSTSGVISAEAITVTAQANSKTYDGTTSAAAAPLVTTGTLYDPATLSETYDTKNVGTGKTLTPLAAINDGVGGADYKVTYVDSTSGVISAEAITVTAQANSKTYDGTTSAAAAPLVTTGTLYDPATLSETYDTKNVGTGKTLTPLAAINDGVGGADYKVTYVDSTSGVISAEAITVTAQANSKTYDGTTSAAATPLVTTGTLYDPATLSETYDTKNVGTGKTLTPLAVINDGVGGADYKVTYVDSTSGVVTAEAITVTAQANSKTYDGTTSAAATPLVTTGTLYDPATLSETYDTKNVGTGKTLTPLAVINDGVGGADYKVTYVNSTSGVISAEAITVTAQANSKTYDGTTSAAAAPLVTTGTLYDPATLSETYDTKNVGTGKTLTPLAAINDGVGGADYKVTYVDSTSGVISAEAITVTAQANSKTYDGTTSAAAAPLVTTGTLYDPATLSETYDTKNVGTGKTLTPLAAINDGVGGADYKVTYVDSTSGVISAEAITVTAQANSKTYDGTTSAAATPLVTTGTLYDPATLSETYDTKNVGTGKTLTPLAVINDGVGGADYKVTYVNSTSGVITTATLTITANNAGKTYGQTATFSSTAFTETGLVNGDTVTGVTETSTGAPASAAPGTYPIVPSAATGSGLGNYNIGYANGTLTVIAATLTVTKTADSSSVSIGTNGAPVGYTVTISNTSTVAATGLTLNDPLPPGAYSDINWTIDTSKGNPSDFAISGSVGSQTLTLASGFNTLAANTSIVVHYTGTATANDTNTSANPALNVGGAASYAVLYEGTGSNQLSITNDTIDGNIGVGGGQVQFNGPGTIGGRLDFSAANSGQYHNTNGSNVGPTSVNYNVSAVTTAINAVNSLSTSLGGLSGTNISFNNSNQTVNESSGSLQTTGGVSYRVFNVTSYSENNNDTVTINGDGSGDTVVFNFTYSSNTNLGGQVTLTGGLTDDEVMWNFTSSGKNVQLTNNGGTYAGVIILPNDNFNSNNYNLNGRVYGGSDGNMQLTGAANVYAPATTGTLTNTATVSATDDPTSASATATITITSAPLPQLAGGSSSSAGAGVSELLGSTQLHTGTLGVAIELPKGPQTAAELAAIRTAIATLDDQIAPLGVSLVVASGAQAASAPVHITMASSSAIGGLDQGVLGAYTPGGDITLITGWNWYFGSEPGKIAQNQFDFQTVVTHELGHVLGLGENSDPASVMDLYLSPGQVRRDLTATDLSAIRQELQASSGPLPASVAPAVSAPVLPPAAVPAGPVGLSESLARALRPAAGPVAPTNSGVGPDDTSLTNKLDPVLATLQATGKKKTTSRFGALDRVIDDLYGVDGLSIDLGSTILPVTE